MPAASLKAPAATLITAVPLLLAAGVKMAVTTLGSELAIRELRLPPLTARELALKLLPGASENVKVIVAVWPARREAALEEMETVGRVVSIVIDGESEAAAVLALPAASVNLPAATETVPGAVELGVGVNVAV